ncbi:hypothetical protein AVEN_157873-1 [Araneus ventricosus]|uniref:Uncharacterized protein n=1 Tax=Araneus ventricosus TaxID=182803 RepID=A0A4Y2E668_ARAVE|nr:hypothetical protein AVEN_157873-1 [Araneus ventricosus]
MATQHTARINVRNKCYTKSSFNESSSRDSLPPTEAAVHQHSLRVYHQIQHRFGNKKRHEDWGWENTNSGLQPIKSLKLYPADSILRKISCKCKKVYTGNCSVIFACRGRHRSSYRRYWTINVKETKIN